MRIWSIVLLVLFLLPGCRLWGTREKAREGEAARDALHQGAALQAAAPPLPREAPLPGGTLFLRVGKNWITREEFDQRYQEALLADGSEQKKPLTREEFLERLILDEILEKYAGEERIDQEPRFLGLLSQNKQRILLDYILETRLSDKIAVIDEEIAWYYNEKIEEFSKPPQIQVRHILTATIEEAREALGRLEGGENFADVARDMSIHTSRIFGGQLPPFSRGTYNRDFEDAAFPLKVGERSPIIKTELGYHIIEKTGEIPQATTPLDQVKEEIRQKIKREKKERVLDSFYRKLRYETEVEILGAP